MRRRLCGTTCVRCGAAFADPDPQTVELCDACQRDTARAEDTFATARP